MEDDTRRRLGYWITQARELAGLTREELAAKLNVSRQTVYMWEVGKKAPSLLSLGPLCDALGISSELFRDLPEVPQSPAERYLRPAARRGFARGMEPGGSDTPQSD